MLMSSTLERDSSSVLRSRPIGLPRYQENEKCGPRMAPPASHWQPTEFCAVFTSPATLVSCATVWSVTPPHCGKNGPWCGGADGAPDDSYDCVLPESDPEHAAIMLVRLTTASASAVGLPRITMRTYCWSHDAL